MYIYIYVYMYMYICMYTQIYICIYKKREGVSVIRFVYVLVSYKQELLAFGTCCNNMHDKTIIAYY